MIQLLIYLAFSFLTIANDRDFEKEALKDLPEPTMDYLFWNLRPDQWMWKEEYLAKGQFYKIPAESKRTISSWTLKVYDNKELSGIPSFRIQDQYFFYDGNADKITCNADINVKGTFPEEYLICRGSYCYKNKASKEEIIDRRDLHLKSLNSKKHNCQYRVNVVTIDEGSGFIPTPDENSRYNIFKYNSIDSNKKFLEINVNGKSAYVDIKHCPGLKSRVKCGPLEIKLSEHERAWIELKRVQKEKNHKMLNLALKKVLPCVKKRDIPCVQKYFMTKEKLESFDDWFVKTEFTEDTFKELDACLKYESLLAHQQATRGINKACIFENDTDGIIFQNVSYPEALSQKGAISRLID